MFFNQLGHYCRFETDRVVYLIFCSPGGDCCFQISLPQSCSSEPTTTCQWMSCREITIDNSQTLLKPFLQVEKRKAQKVWWSIFNWFFTPLSQWLLWRRWFQGRFPDERKSCVRGCLKNPVGPLYQQLNTWVTNRGQKA